jgi:hypothetical protein
VERGESHDCWTTTEQALTANLSEDLRDAWERLRETAAEFGEQRIYASHHCIMFSRQACYFFVRPKRNVLELAIFLGRAINAPQVRRVMAASNVKKVHIVHVRHRDEVESPITDWLREAYDVSESLSASARQKAAQPGGNAQAPASKKPTKTPGRRGTRSTRASRSAGARTRRARR